MSDQEIDLQAPLRDGADVAEMKRLLAWAIQAKPQGHHLDQALAPRARTMAEIGG
jgi:molybdenum cofactor biosynthesis enzyme MoaA